MASDDDDVFISRRTSRSPSRSIAGIPLLLLVRRKGTMCQPLMLDPMLRCPLADWGHLGSIILLNLGFISNMSFVPHE
jgi:hypothetical protein